MAKKTIVVGGFGPGISTAVAEKFGREGFSVALVARNQERLDAGVKALKEKGIEAQAFAADLSDPEAAKGVVQKASKALGPVTVLHWNAYGGGAGDLTTAPVSELRGIFDIAIVGLVSAIQTALPELEKDKESAILITNGGLGFAEPKVDAMGVQWNAMGLSLANAAKHKLVGLLTEKLKDKSIYVGQVIVLGTVKGTAWDSGQATLEASTIADRFWALYKERKESTAQVG